MKSPKNSHNPIELLRYADGRRDVVMSLPQFSELDSSAKEIEGEGLAQLAISDPIRMYRLFQKQLEALAREGNMDEVEVNGRSVAAKGSATQREIATKALGLIRQLPDSDVESFAFGISVFPSAIDETALGIDEPIKVIDVRMTPSNFAS